MTALHAALAWLALASTLGVLVIGVIAALRPTPSRRWIDRAILLQLACVAATIAIGLVLPIIGPGPRDLLHFVYAAVALIALPLARYTVRARNGKAFGGWIAVAALAVIGALLRSFMTGR